MRKPFSEVVAGLSAADSGFPPLQHRKQHPSISEKGSKKNWERDIY
jgi:protein SMG8